MPQEYLEKKLFEAYKETEKRVFKESFYHAICHDNLHLVEILIDKGFDYTQLLDDTRSAIIICTDKDTVRVLEYLLIISVRENNFYTFNDLHYVLNWALANRHYEVIDILLYALKQDSQSPQSFVKFITIKDLMTAFGDIAKSGHDIPKNQMLNLKNLITSNPISKRQMNYLYYIWSEVFEENHLQGQEIYNWLSDSYYALDKDRRTKKVSREIVISAFFSPLLVLAAGLLYIISQDVYLGLNNMLSGDLSSMQTPITSHRYLFVFLLFSLYLGIVALGHSAVKLFLSSIKNIFKYRAEQFDRDLIYHSRKGDYDKVVYLITKRKAHVNVIAGIAETTPLYEAQRGQHQRVEEVLIDNGGYSMQGNKVF